MSLKLYLILESCDSGGYNILATRLTIDECVEWLDERPFHIPYGVVARVEASTETIYFGVIPVTHVATKLNRETRVTEVISSAMDEPMMREWMKKEGSKHPYHCISQHSGPFINMWMAENEQETQRIGGKFECISTQPRSCRVSEESLP